MVAGVLALVAALAALTVDVPFVSQTEALCGGAAAAMVFRYWGEAHADAQQFAPLIQRARGRPAGIADDVLTRAIAERGWNVDRTSSSLTALRAHLDARQPVIVLLSDSRDRYHYVVVVGVDDGDVTVHDPSWGPQRRLTSGEFSRLWSASRNWSLVVLPSETRPARPAPPPTETPSTESAPVDSCDARLNGAIARVRTSGLDRADEFLEPVRSACPDSPGPLRELAGVRFAQRRWADASALARNALARDRNDSYALDVLAASLFMQDDAPGALRAWNRIDRPRLDLIRIEGLRRSRYQIVAEALGLQANTLLTADAFLQAQHRLDEMPDRASARLDVRPAGDGFAAVDVVIAERDGIRRRWPEWTAPAVRAAVDREAALVLPGATGQGETWSASWRWWNNRPRVAVGFAAPRVARLPGIWRVDASWEEETFLLDAGALTRESRVHGGLSVSDWLSGHVRYELRTGLDSWRTGARAAYVGGSLERRWLDDRVAASADGTAWAPFDGSTAFQRVAIHSRVWSVSPRRAAQHRWIHTAAAGIERVSDAAPMMLWSGAGEGRARPTLLRAHPLLDDGMVAAQSRSTLGRSLQFVSAETQQWLARPVLPRIGVAGFVDAARIARQSGNATSVIQVDIGAGLRVRIPGTNETFRVDVARGIRDGATALTAGWTF